jgi:hypothetical protein
MKDLSKFRFKIIKIILFPSLYFFLNGIGLTGLNKWNQGFKEILIAFGLLAFYFILYYSLIINNKHNE